MFKRLSILAFMAVAACSGPTLHNPPASSNLLATYASAVNFITKDPAALAFFGEQPTPEGRLAVYVYDQPVAVLHTNPPLGISRYDPLWSDSLESYYVTVMRAVAAAGRVDGLGQLSTDEKNAQSLYLSVPVQGTLTAELGYDASYLKTGERVRYGAWVPFRGCRLQYHMILVGGEVESGESEHECG